MTSLQVLRDIYSSLKTSSLRKYHTFMDLAHLKWLGDDNMQRFRHNVMDVLGDVGGDEMADDTKCDLLLGLYQDPDAMKDEAKDFRLLADGDPKKCFRTLRWVLWTGKSTFAR